MPYLVGFQQTPTDAPEEDSKLPVEGDTYRERYDHYINSKRWQKRRIAYYAVHDKRCRACDSTEQIHLHHHTYARMGYEHDDDLVPLCESCHTQVHQLHQTMGRQVRSKKKPSLTEATKLFLQWNGRTLHPPRRRMTPKQQRTKNRRPPVGPPPLGCITKERAAEILGVPVGILPKPKQRKQCNKGFFREEVVVQWRDKCPPRWLRAARGEIVLLSSKQKVDRITPAPIDDPLEVNDRVRISLGDSRTKWANERTGTVVSQVGAGIWHVQLDDMPLSRLAVTRQMVQRLQ